MAIIGVPTVAARCIGPESVVIIICALFIRQASSLRLVHPAALTAGYRMREIIPSTNAESPPLPV
jgi:hypothetical protein